MATHLVALLFSYEAWSWDALIRSHLHGLIMDWNDVLIVQYISLISQPILATALWDHSYIS
jgi:hypothetical protein